MIFARLRAPVLVGILLIATVLGALYMVSVVKTTVFTDADSYTVYAIFEDVTGLVENSNVTMVGIPVGVIRKIDRVRTEEGMRARVDISVSREVVLYAGEADPDGRLRGAASVTRKQSSILGDFYLALAPGALGPALADGDEIPIVIQTSGMEALFEQMQQMSQLYPRVERILTNIEEISGGLASAVGGEQGRKDLREIVSNIRSISEETRHIAGRARTITAEVERLVEDGTFTRIASNIEETSVDAREIADKVKDMVEAGDVEELVATLTDTAEQLNRVGTQLNELVEAGITPRLTQLERIFGNFERFSQDVADFAGQHRQTLADTVTNFKDFSGQLVTLIQRSSGEIEATMGTVKGTLLSAQLSLQKLDESLENVRQITTDLREGKGSVGRLLTDDKLVEEIEEIVTDTKDFVKSYTLMQTEVELSSNYFFYDQSMKNIVSLRFRPKEDKYYLLQIVDDPRGYTTDEFTIVQTSDPSKPPILKEEKEKTSRALKFSFQFAKRFYFVTGRFGILENTGGLGLDFNFFKDRLQFQFDLFDFAMDNNPRLRSLVQWEVIKHFFIAGGADDLLNPAYRDYFMSAGIRFTDDDLKALLFAAPSISP